MSDSGADGGGDAGGEAAVRRRPVDAVGGGGSAVAVDSYAPKVTRTAGESTRSGGDGEAFDCDDAGGHTFVPLGVKPFALLTDLSTKGANEEATGA